MLNTLISYGVRCAPTFALTAALVGCGGSDNIGGGPTPPVSPPVTERAGRLESAALLSTVPVTDISAALAAKESLAQDVVPRYAVTSYRLDYLTTDADGREVRASGMVSVPQKPAGAKSPLLSYQHGTIFRDAEAPSNNAVASEVAVVLASLGYIVLAPDYVGFGSSKGTQLSLIHI